jgi:hypothetical protein
MIADHNLVKKSFGPMIAGHDLVRAIMDAEVSTHIFLTMIIEEYVCFMSCEPFFFFAIILMWYFLSFFRYGPLFFYVGALLRISVG